MVFKIDLDRGVHSRTDPGTGMEVYMYVDDPGVYLSAHGTEVDVELAKRAGFEVEGDLKKHHIKMALANARDKVLAELKAADNTSKVVTAERDGFKIINLGFERYQVLDPDGDVLTPQHLDLHEASILLDQLAPNPEEVMADVPPADPKGVKPAV